MSSKSSQILPADAYEPDNTCTQARPITANGPAQTHNFHTESDVDWVKFDARVGYGYILETSNLGENADTVLELYQSDCTTQIAWNDDGGSGLASRIIWNADFDGTAYAKVRPFSSSRTGAGSNYDLSLRSETLNPDNYEPDNSCSQAPLIAMNGPPRAHNFHTESDVDWVKFTAIAGTWYEIRTENLDVNADTVLELYGSDCSTPTAIDDDSGGGLASRVVWVAPTNGRQYVKIRPYNEARTGIGSSYDLSINTTSPQGIALYVRDQRGTGAANARVEVYSDTTWGYDLATTTSPGGYLYLNLADGEYTLTAASENDRFVLVRENVTAPTSLSMSAEDTSTVNLYATLPDGSPMANADVYFQPYPTSQGGVGPTDERGHLRFNATPGRYNGFVWDRDDLVYLSRTNLNIQRSTSLYFDARNLPVGQMIVDLSSVSQAWVAPFGTHTTWGPIFEVTDGASLTLTEDSYNFWDWLTKGTGGNDQWYYFLTSPGSFAVPGGGTNTYHAGGAISASTQTQQEMYHPGQDVLVQNVFRDAFGNRIRDVYLETPSQNTLSASEGNAKQNRGPKTPPPDIGRQAANLTKPAQPSAKTGGVKAAGKLTSQTEPTSRTYIDPATQLVAPDGTVVAEYQGVECYDQVSLQLPSPAAFGQYTTVTSLDTGPYQGDLQAASSFRVEPIKVHLPVILKQGASAPAVCDAGFEAGYFEPCWQHGGELAQQVVDHLHSGEPPFAGHYSALLGQPELGSGTDGNIPAGSAWIQQRIRVPNTTRPRLTFQYRVISYDASVGSRGQLWDTFDTSIGGELVFRDDEGEGRPPGSQGVRHDTGWQRGAVDLSHWRGQEVSLRFAVWNREYDGNGMDYYNTWAYLDQVRVKP